MRTLFVLLLLSAAAASAQTSRWASADDKTAVWMISQARRWAETACDGNDVVQTLLADDFQGTSPSGKRYSKPTAAEKPSARDCKLGEVTIRFFGNNLAIAYGSESLVRTSKDGKEDVETEPARPTPGSSHPRGAGVPAAGGPWLTGCLGQLDRSCPRPSDEPPQGWRNGVPLSNRAFAGSA